MITHSNVCISVLCIFWGGEENSISKLFNWKGDSVQNYSFTPKLIFKYRILIYTWNWVQQKVGLCCHGNLHKILKNQLLGPGIQAGSIVFAKFRYCFAGFYVSWLGMPRRLYAILFCTSSSPRYLSTSNIHLAMWLASAVCSSFWGEDWKRKIAYGFFSLVSSVLLFVKVRKAMFALPLEFKAVSIEIVLSSCVTSYGHSITHAVLP